MPIWFPPLSIHVCPARTLALLGSRPFPVWNSLRFTETVLPSYISAENVLAAVNMKRAIDSSSRKQRQTDKE
ncbi:hypothetical protein PsorP6_000814 [Peronosclerospora sorghi]|uniref:Uncharacterized protein n=1 Tax=Peronosclerospora sorghi TaxID=230839 RepID=A0ACC0WT90_9STRA|nr:hypothetical protein PsorP6_000814 [Peronosclerospora sorghi]